MTENYTSRYDLLLIRSLKTLRKLLGAECHQIVFEDAALEAIVNSAGGIPGVINKICNTSLLIGNARRKVCLKEKAQSDPFSDMFHKYTKIH